MADVAPSGADDARFDFQLRMLKKGASELRAQISRLDDLLFKIKASFIAVCRDAVSVCRLRDWIAGPFES